MAKFGIKCGPNFMSIFGAFMQAVCTVSFGFLTFVQDLRAFLGLSYLLRALDGIAVVVAWNAIVSILMKCFPNKVSTLMSITEMTFGLGYSVGPVIGNVDNIVHKMAFQNCVFTCYQLFVCISQLFVCISQLFVYIIQRFVY